MRSKLDKQIFVTKQGLKKLKNEYMDLVGKVRQQIALRIQKARESGDLTENAEYEAAREEQAVVEGRILELDDILKKAQVVNKAEKCKVITLGCKVKVKLEEQEDEFEIVGAEEADPLSKKISHESPLGKALLGKKPGDKVLVEAPAGKITYVILEIK